MGGKKKSFCWDGWEIKALEACAKRIAIVSETLLA